MCKDVTNPEAGHLLKSKAGTYKPVFISNLNLKLKEPYNLKGSKNLFLRLSRKGGVLGR